MWNAWLAIEWWNCGALAGRQSKVTQIWPNIQPLGCTKLGGCGNMRTSGKQCSKLSSKIERKKYVHFKVSTQACWKEIICSEILRALWGDLKVDFFDLDTSIYLHSIVRHPSLHPLPSQLTSLSEFLRPLSYTDFNNNIMLTMRDCVLN